MLPSSVQNTNYYTTQFTQCYRITYLLKIIQFLWQGDCLINIRMRNNILIDNNGTISVFSRRQVRGGLIVCIYERTTCVVNII